MTLSKQTKALRALLIAALLLIPPTSAVAADDVRLFRTEQQAQQHCPTDVVVRVNTASGVYHYRGL